MSFLYGFLLSFVSKKKKKKKTLGGINLSVRTNKNHERLGDIKKKHYQVGLRPFYSRGCNHRAQY